MRKSPSGPYRIAIVVAVAITGGGTPLIAQAPRLIAQAPRLIAQAPRLIAQAAQPPASLTYPAGSVEADSGGQPVAAPPTVPGIPFSGATDSGVPGATDSGATVPGPNAGTQSIPNSIPPERLAPMLPVAGPTTGLDAGTSTVPGRRIATQGGGQAASILHNVGAAGEMIGFSHVDQGGTERITLVHTGKSWMAVYHIDQSGMIRLISSRPIDADFSLQLNATSPRPEEIRQMAGPSR